MIDTKAIKAAAEAATPQPWIEPGEGNMPFICMMTPDVVSAMCDEIERLRKDAARYQWLKNMFGWHIVRDYLVDVEGTNNLDAVIDAAMEAK